MDEYSIRVRDSAGKVFTAKIERLPFWIGRGTENDIVLNEPSVSKRHAYIAQSPQGLVIVDNKSRNGVVFHKDKTRVQGSRALSPDEMFLIGHSLLKVERTRPLEIPADFTGAERVTFFAAKETWDPLGTLALSAPLPLAGERAAMTPAAERPLAKPRPSTWQKLIPRLLLEASTEGICDLILEMTAAEVAFDRCFIVLFDEQDPESVSIVAKRIHNHSAAKLIISKQLLKRVAQSKEAAIVRSHDLPQVVSQSFLYSGASSALCVPLMIAGEVTGALYLDRLTPGVELSEEDIESLGPLAGLIALKLENVQLVKEQIASQLLQRDLELAKSIQESLLPQDAVSFPGYAMDGYSAPCLQVGGDYFDIIAQGGSRAILVIGDVSGKGLASALYMACVRSCLHAHLVDGVSLTDLMSRLELHARSTFRSDHFLTLFVAALDLDSGVLTYCNAGHLPGLVLGASGEVFELEASAPALNIAPWGAYEARQHSLDPGDLLVLCTDGLVEAESPREEQFGMDRLLASALKGRDAPLCDLRLAMLADIEAFTEGARPRDDSTLILVRREATGSLSSSLQGDGRGG